VSHPSPLVGDALQDGVDVAADQMGGRGRLRRARPHHGLAQVVLVDLERDAILGPEPREDVEIALEEPAAALERHATAFKLTRVPAGGDAEDQAALRDHVERTTCATVGPQRARLAVRFDRGWSARRDLEGAA